MTAPPGAERYAGRDNLEVMDVAVNYNRWLAGLATAWLGTSGRILDFGSGSGTLTRLLRERGMSVLAVEPDATLSSALSAEGVEVHRSLDTVPAGSLDGIASFNVLEHIEDDAQALQALATKLRAHGRLFLYVPAFQSLYSSMDRKVGHFRRYRRRPLVHLLESCGFRVHACRYADSLGFGAALLYKALGSDTGQISSRSVRVYDRLLFPASRLIDWLIRGTVGKNVLAMCTVAPTGR